MVATAKESKIRYYDTEKGQIAWALPDDLPAYAFEQDGVKKKLGLVVAEPAVEPVAPPVVAAVVEAPVVTKPHDYGRIIGIFEDRLRMAQEHYRSAQTPATTHAALTQIEQYRLAVENAKEAESITEEAAQFGNRGDEFSFRLPPRVPEFAEMSQPVRSSSRRYLATDPLEIAWLRRMVREGTLEEVPVGSFCCVPITGIGQARWRDAKTYYEMLEDGQINP